MDYSVRKNLVYSFLKIHNSTNYGFFHFDGGIYRHFSCDVCRTGEPGIRVKVKVGDPKVSGYTFNIYDICLECRNVIHKEHLIDE